MNNQYPQAPNQGRPNQIPQTTTLLDLNSFDRNVFNVLMPVTKMAAQSDLQRVMVNVVTLDCRQDEYNKGPSKDIYYERSCSQYAITKVGGMKLAAAANISVAGTTTGRSQACERCIDMAKATGRAQPCGTCPHVYDTKVTVTLRVPEPSGGYRLIAASKEFDAVTELDDMSEKQRKRVIANRAAVVESKAFMRAVRAALGIAGSYTMQDIQKPFVIAHIVPNFNAPEIREVMAANVMQSMGMLFAPAAGNKALPEASAPMAAPEDTYEDDSPIGNDTSDFDDDYMDIPDDGPQGYGGYNQPPAAPPQTYGGYNPPPQPPAQPRNTQQEVCSECKQVIQPYTTRQNTTWSPADIIAFSMRQFKRPMCYQCQQKLKGGRR